MIQSYKWLPIVDEDVCTGCGQCVDVCGPNCLEIVNGIALLTSARACGSEEHCIAECPEDAIHMQWIPLSRIDDFGKWKVVDEIRPDVIS